jgi:hypothetical protein
MTTTFLQPDGVPITAQQTRQGSAALYGGGAGRPLGGRSGFRVGTPASVLTATSTTWTLMPCAAMIDPGASTNQGMYGWASDANITGSMTAADATYTHIDIVYIQLNDSSAGDGSGATSAPVLYAAGAPTATPTAPTLPPRSFLLGTITVPKVGAGSPTVTLNPARFVAAGGILPVMSQAERDGLTPYAGLAVSRLDLPGAPAQTYDGTAWWPQQLAPLQTTGWALTGDIDVSPVGAHKRVVGTVHINRSGGAFTPTGGVYVAIGGSGTQLLPNAAISSAGQPYYTVGVVSGAGITPVKGVVFVGGNNGTVSFMPDSTFTWPTNAFLDVNINHTV